MTEPLTTSTHTAGPWTLSIGELGGHPLVVAGKQIIALDFLGDRKVQNARLVAAAPELLAALKSVACPQCEVIFAKHPEYYESHPCEKCAPWRRLIAIVEGR